MARVKGFYPGRQFSLFRKVLLDCTTPTTVSSNDKAEFGQLKLYPIVSTVTARRSVLVQRARHSTSESHYPEY
jgi:hypothetical protein